MHKEMSDRIREAGLYQKKAIHVLFPDSTNRHLEVIEHEIKEMLTEEIAGAVMQYQSGGSNGKQAENSTSNESEAQTGASNAKSKKINIE